MSAPHKLKDGSGQWDDGVDRSKRIHAVAFAIKNPNRVHVWRGARIWWVIRVSDNLSAGRDTHAEAIAFADKAARRARS